MVAVQPYSCSAVLAHRWRWPMRASLCCAQSNDVRVTKPTRSYVPPSDIRATWLASSLLTVSLNRIILTNTMNCRARGLHEARILSKWRLLASCALQCKVHNYALKYGICLARSTSTVYDGRTAKYKVLYDYNVLSVDHGHGVQCLLLARSV